ncbi:hypothetical protein ACTMU2_22715 [Cupriavidus basilensis]
MADVNGTGSPPDLRALPACSRAAALLARAEALGVERVRNVVPSSAPPLVIAGDVNDWNHRLDAQICNTLGTMEASHARGARLHTFPRKPYAVVAARPHLRARLRGRARARADRARLGTALGPCAACSKTWRKPPARPRLGVLSRNRQSGC